jgi:hypothetical protein
LIRYLDSTPDPPAPGVDAAHGTRRTRRA